MTGRVRPAFERRIVMLPLSSLLPLRQVPASVRKTSKYKRIARSIQEIGIIEPLVVARSKDHRDRYLLLDGHLRHAILEETGHSDTRCLIAEDDEAFTYNKRLSRLATVQEHFMIVRAIELGASEERLAKALDVDIKVIRNRRTMLDGICPEAVELLTDKSVNPATFAVLRKLKPMRQIEAAELMITAANYSASYAKALLAATRQTDLAKPDQPKRIAGMTQEQMARMEREMASLQSSFKEIEASYGDDVLHLVIATGYLAKLVGNREIECYLRQYHPEILTEFQAIIAAASLDQTRHAA